MRRGLRSHRNHALFSLGRAGCAPVNNVAIAPGGRTTGYNFDRPSQTIVELIERADAAAQAAGSEAEAARARALDPTLASEVVSAARRRMEDSAFERDRMATAVEQLRARLLVVKADEEDARRLRVYEDAKLERDRLADELKSFYPDVAERLAELLARIVANYEVIERINAHGLPREHGRLLCAELTARNCMSSEHFGQLAWQFKRMSGSSGLKVQRHLQRIGHVGCRHGGAQLPGQDVGAAEKSHQDSRPRRQQFATTITCISRNSI
jgi:hypothetical protein